MTALELVFSLTPELAFPFLTKGLDKYATTGYGGMLKTGVTPIDYLTVGTTAGFFSIPKQSSSKFDTELSKNVFFVPLGLNVGTQYYPVSRLELTASLSGGFSLAISDKQTHEQPWYRAEAGAAFRINPSFSIGLNVSWTDFQYNSWFKNPLMQGITAGISFTYRYDTRKSSGSVSATVDYDDNVFPLLYTVYKENSFGTINISNDETAEIKNVRVYVRAQDYTASELECGHISNIPKHKSASVPLIADFSDSILQFTENGQIPAEVVINYELLGQKRTAVSQIIIPVYNRNQMRWADPAVLASLVSASSQEVMEFSKSLVGIGRRYLRTGLNQNMQFAMYLFEGMRIAGIQYETDSSTPYGPSHIDTAVLDYLQYPYQTMQYKSGDIDDLGILLMSLLQSVGIQASFIATQDDFIVLFNTEIDSAHASSYFNGDDHIIVLEDDNIWIPLSMKVLGEGFINSWYKAMEEINIIIQTEQEYYFVGIADAWTYYPPAGFTSGENVSLSISEKTVSDTVETDIVRYITAEFGPQITAIQNRIKNEGASAGLYNQLGMLYVRAGMYSNAVPVFQLAVKMGSTTAMNNLGNIASLQKNYEEAVVWYKKVLEVDPDNESAKANLNRVMSELEN
ncbi:MAG: tetratricopeptide repeat protein [Treponema sp.]|nr:tetratricopeptide repeat protein [Treponema sp.]